MADSLSKATTSGQALLRLSAVEVETTDMTEFEDGLRDPIFSHYFSVEPEIGAVALCGYVKWRPRVSDAVAKKFPLCAVCDEIARRRGF